jgi:hypothetical protein
MGGILTRLGIRMSRWHNISNWQAYPRAKLATRGRRQAGRTRERVPGDLFDFARISLGWELEPRGSIACPAPAASARAIDKAVSVDRMAASPDSDCAEKKT